MTATMTFIVRKMLMFFENHYSSFAEASNNNSIYDYNDIMNQLPLIIINQKTISTATNVQRRRQMSDNGNDDDTISHQCISKRIF